MKTAFAACRLFTPVEEIKDPVLLVEDGRISDVYSRSEKEVSTQIPVLDFSDSILTPGYIDIHTHGGAGVDLMRASPSDYSRLDRFLASHGVAAYFPTTVAAPLDATFAALDRLAGAIETEEENGGAGGGARPLGIHLEGPFLSHKRRGVHPPENLVEPTIPIFDRLWQAARGHVRMVTIAPELPGAMEVITEAVRRGVCISIGHSDAEISVAQQAVKAGARHATHTFNAMRPLDHRDPGIVAEVLTEDQLSADIIVDGIHVSPPVVKLFLKAKGTERAVLITDSIAAAGMPDGHYQLGPIEVEVKDGKCTSGGSLAGSVLTMDLAVRNVTRFSEWSLRDAVRAASLNPAHSAALAGHGALKAGARADFLVLNSGGEVLKTFVGGKECV
ncbi:MAG TPA: N-acetylglucosamine-6-phosphate deacetylase [Candidatus Sulfotelmatobacter sp.]|nr:N-acetylglucosamine-6-phosphate deacetylase [Candidatus Sulfotelmatobacter sp.]